MLDEEHGHAPVVGEPANEIAELARLGLVETGRGLVEQQDRRRRRDRRARCRRVGAARRAARPGGDRGRPRARTPGRCSRRSAAAPVAPGQNRSRSPASRVCSPAPACRFSATEMSSNSSSDWNERRTPGASTSRRTPGPSDHRRAVEGHLAGARLGEARHRVDDRRLARAVRTDEPDHLAGPDAEAHVVDARRPRRTERSDPRTSSVAGRHGAGSRPRGAPRGEAVRRSRSRSLPMPRSSLSTTLAMPFGLSITMRMRMTPPIVMSHEPRSTQSSTIEPTPPSARLPPNTAPSTQPMPPATALPTVLIDWNGLVAAVDDGRVLEREQDARERRDRGTDGEGVELGAEDADPERRGGALVVAHRDESSPRSGATEVGDHQRGDHEDAEAHDEIAMRVLGRADVPAEHLDPADRRDRSEVTGEVLVAEDHLLDGEARARG